MARSPRLRRLIVAALLAVATRVLYAPVDRLPFVNYDDNEYVYDDPPVLAGLSAATVRWAFTTGHAANYHPLAWLSLAADASLAGPTRPPIDWAHPSTLASRMHETSADLHAANVAVLFLLLAVATGADAAAAVAAAVFAAHPVHVESVAWVAERKDVLCGLFYLLAMGAHTAYARATTPGWRWAAYGATLVLGGAALLSKPMAVSLPFALLLWNVWPLRRAIRPRRAVLEQLPLGALSAAFCWVTVAVQSAGGAVQSLANMPLAARAQNVPAAYARYLLKLAWPTGLTVFYPYHNAPPPAGVIGSVVLLAVVTAVAVRVGRRLPYVTVGWLWFLVTLGPVIGIVQVGWQSIADRYAYLPMIGPAVAVVWGVRQLSRRRPAVGGGIAVAVAVVFARMSLVQLGYWTSTRALFERSLAVAPDNAVAHTQLGYLEKSEGHPDAARRHYEAAAGLVRGYGDAAYNLGNLLVTKDPAEAARYYRLALASWPGDPRVQNNLGVALSADPATAAEAARQFAAAARDNPAWADPHLNMGRLLLSHGRPDLARVEFAAAVRLNPSSAAARRGLAEAGR